MMKLLALIPEGRLREITVAYELVDARREDLEIQAATGTRKAWPADVRGQVLIRFDSRAARRAGFRIEAVAGVGAYCDALTT